MKKVLYLILLIIGGIVVGSLIADRASMSESMNWLAYSGGFTFPADKPLIDFTIITITIGFSFSISIAQLLMVLVALFVYYKTAPKLIP
ncbi:MAG: DUF4321 domain-containing protein [Ruminococcus flavefaciens]|nr:DUF4321 domain-containing protein [Ruminococcus flavefaciens]